MVVTRRTPVVSPPALTRNHSSQGAQPPPRTSFSKDAPGASRDAASDVAVTSLAGPSNSNRDHHNGLVSVRLLYKTKPCRQVWRCRSSIYIRSCACDNSGSTFSVLWNGTRGAHMLFSGRQPWKEVEKVQKACQGKHSFAPSYAGALLISLRTNTENPTSKPSSTSSPNYSSSRLPSTHFPCVRRIHTSNPLYVAA